MRQCIALAGLVCLLAGGCSAGGFTAGRVATSQRAPRPTISRDFRKPGPEPAVKLAAYNASCDAGCGCDETGCGCPVGGTCGPDGCCSCGDSSCCNSVCRGLIDGLAGGGCECGGDGCGYGQGGPGCCLCPNAQGYPEYPAFNQGPPVGQVAYPYYTTHGPRDFLSRRPPNIGPY